MRKKFGFFVLLTVKYDPLSFIYCLNTLVAQLMNMTHLIDFILYLTAIIASRL